MKNHEYIDLCKLFTTYINGVNMNIEYLATSYTHALRNIGNRKIY